MGKERVEHTHTHTHTHIRTHTVFGFFLDMNEVCLDECPPRGETPGGGVGERCVEKDLWQLIFF